LVRIICQGDSNWKKKQKEKEREKEHISVRANAT
jgi:hypothetical protein